MKIPSYFIPAGFIFISSLLSFYLLSAQADPSTTQSTPKAEKTATETQAPQKNGNRLRLPETADAGTVIKLKWDIEQAFDGLITLKYTDNISFNQEIPAYISKGASYLLRLPSRKGSVQIALQKGQQILARKTLILNDPTISIQADKQSIVANRLDVTWYAPKGLNGFINIQKADDTANYYAQPHINITPKSKGSLHVPPTEGDYILRWYSRHDRQILAELPITLIGSKLVIIAPDQAMAGKILPLSWQAPQGLDAFINIQATNRVADYKATPYVYINDDYRADLQLPDEAGHYMLRWYDRNSRKVLTQHPITLTGSIISIQAPKEALINSEITLTWRAPENLDAFINLQLADEKADYNATPYIYTHKKPQGTMQMPRQAGDYILRWYNRTDHKMLAETKITLINPLPKK